jgi:hypothetical protein
MKTSQIIAAAASSLALLVNLLIAPAAQAQRTDWGSSYRGGRGSGGLSRTPAYRYSTSPPRLDYIQPRYQSAYRYDRGGPAFGGTPFLYDAPDLRLGTRLLPYTYSRYGSSSGHRRMFYRGSIYRPYVTTSQYIYQPTYFSRSADAVLSPPAAVYGAYGYAAMYGK